MGFKETLKPVGQWLTDKAIHLTADGLEVAGVGLCMASGAGFSLSRYFSSTVRAAYYGQGTFNDTVDFQLAVTEFDFKMEESLPLNYSYEHFGSQVEYVDEYVAPLSMEFYSTVAGGAGFGLRLLSANLKKWQQGREDLRAHIGEEDAESIKPTRKEYLYVNANALASSAALLLYSGALCESLLYIYFTEPNLDFTYPASGGVYANTTAYSGPLANYTLPIKFALEREVNITLPGTKTEIPAEETVKVNGDLVLSYGLGLFARLPARNLALPPVFAVAAQSAWLAHNFFARKIDLERDNRVNRGYPLPWLYDSFELDESPSELEIS